LRQSRPRAGDEDGVRAFDAKARIVADRVVVLRKLVEEDDPRPNT
jgi:hypothetical protein